jgi:hypothetical protein
MARPEPGAVASTSAVPSPVASAVVDDSRLTSVVPPLRSDWPAALAQRRSVVARAREEGTDGLMGRLPFGLPNDTPYPPAERVNKFTIDDILGRAPSLVTTPPWVRSRGGERANG